MKKITEIIHCISSLMKKKFFIGQKTDIYQDCRKVTAVNQLLENSDDKEAEEYLKNYTATTRWQTV